MALLSSQHGILSTVLLIVILITITTIESIAIRKNAKDLTTAEKNKLLKGIYLLKSTPSIYDTSYNAYDYFVYVHLHSNDPYTTYGHAQWSFPVWHRIFLHLFEEELRRVLNDSDITLPYWDVTNSTNSDLLLSDESFLGGDGDEEFPYFLSNTSSLSCNKFKVNHQLNGRKWQYNYTCLSRTIGAGRSIDDEIFIAKTLPHPQDWEDLIDTYRPYDVSPWNTAYNRFTYQHHLQSFRSLLDGCIKWKYWKQNSSVSTPEISPDLETAVNKGACPAKTHGNLHVYIGGQLASPASPNDPLFFLLHSFVDLMWSRYQDKYGDDSFPLQQFGNVDLFLDDYFKGIGWRTARDVMDHRTQLNYIYDIQVNEYSTTFYSTTVDDGNGEKDGDSDNDVMSQGAMIGLIVCCVAFGTICIGSTVWCLCSKQKTKKQGVTKAYKHSRVSTHDDIEMI